MRFKPIETVLLLGMTLLGFSVQAGEPVTVFAAASTKPVLDALAPVLQARDITLKAVHAGSSTLARQIQLGAPADIYISANVRWMDYLTDAGLIVPGSKRTLARNQLVLISGPNPLAAPQMKFGRGYPLDAVLGDERLAIADPDHVPAGIYAREALGTLKLWAQVKDRLARTQNVTSALMMVARGEARMGVVYASDVGRSANVKVFAAFPHFSHSPITYPAALITGSGRAPDRADVRNVMDVLTGPEGRAAFAAAGFEALP